MGINKLSKKQQFFLSMFFIFGSLFVILDPAIIIDGKYELTQGYIYLGSWGLFLGLLLFFYGLYILKTNKLERKFLNWLKPKAFIRIISVITIIHSSYFIYLNGFKIESVILFLLALSILIRTETFFSYLRKAQEQRFFKEVFKDRFYIKK